jgi:hypothetical protein
MPCRGELKPRDWLLGIHHTGFPAGDAASQDKKCCHVVLESRVESCGHGPICVPVGAGFTY